MPIVIRLKELTWLDVLEHLNILEKRKKEEKIAELRSEIESLREFVKQHEGWDYWLQNRVQ